MGGGRGEVGGRVVDRREERGGGGMQQFVLTTCPINLVINLMLDYAVSQQKLIISRTKRVFGWLKISVTELFPLLTACFLSFLTFLFSFINSNLSKLYAESGRSECSCVWVREPQDLHLKSETRRH